MKKIKLYQKIMAVLILLFGLILLFSEPIKKQLIMSYNPNVSEKTSTKKDVSFDMNNVKRLSLYGIIKARFESENIQLLGKIYIPAIKLDLPIGKGVSNNVLSLGVGTMNPDQRMGFGNYALAGHNLDDGKTLFSPLYSKGKVGMNVYLTDMDKIFKYKINKLMYISPYQTSIIQSSKKPILTLITCNDDGSKRLVAQGVLVSVKKK